MGCCGPSTCFTCKNRPISTDACMCGCGYLNGPVTIALAQFFCLVGALLSLGTMIDCSFASIDRTSVDLENGMEIDSIGVGFFFFQKSNGHCYWYNDPGDNGTSNQLRIYWNFLGDVWTVASCLTLICAVFSWYFFLYSLSLCCTSQIKQIRYLNGFLLAGVLTVCQACTFIVYATGFCLRNNCHFSRGSGTSIASMVCYIIAGMGFFFSSDYPGEERLMVSDNRPGKDKYQDEIVHDQEDPGVY